MSDPDHHNWVTARNPLIDTYRRRPKSAGEKIEKSHFDRRLGIEF